MIFRDQNCWEDEISVTYLTSLSSRFSLFIRKLSVDIKHFIDKLLVDVKLYSVTKCLVDFPSVKLPTGLPYLPDLTIYEKLNHDVNLVGELDATIVNRIFPILY